MKTCKDCIHYDICLGAFGDCLYKICDLFKDSSKFIEFPCSIGDTVYTILYHNVFEAEVICIRPFIFKNRIEYRGNVVITMEDPFYSDGRLLEQELFVVFDKDTFLTREEAEKSWKITLELFKNKILRGRRDGL